MRLHGGVQRDTLAPDDQLMQVLAIAGNNLNARAHVLRNELIVENGDIGLGSGPGAVFEDGGRSGGQADHHMRGIGGAETMPIADRRGGPRCEGAQDGGERRLPAPILAIDNRELRERNLSASVHRIELANIPQ